MDNYQALINSAEEKYASGFISDAYKYFLKAVMADSNSIEAKTGLMISCVRLQKYAEAEAILNEIEKRSDKISDIRNHFRITYTKIRIMEWKKEFKDGLIYLEGNIETFGPEYYAILLIEKAALLFFENEKGKALSVLNESNKLLTDGQRKENIGRLVYLYLQLDKRGIALQLLSEFSKAQPNLHTYLYMGYLFLTGCLLNYLSLQAFINIWFIVLLILPVTLGGAIIISILFVLFGVLPIIIFIKRIKQLSFYLLGIWVFSLFFYFGKYYSSVLQVMGIIGVIANIIIQLLVYRSYMLSNKTESSILGK